MEKDFEILSNQFKHTLESFETAIEPSLCNKNPNMKNITETETMKGGIFPIENAKECFTHFMGVESDKKPTIEIINNVSLYGIVLKIHQPIETDDNKSFYRLSMESLLKNEKNDSKLEKVNTLCMKIGFGMNQRLHRQIKKTDKTIQIKVSEKEFPIKKIFVNENELFLEHYHQNIVATFTSKSSIMPCTPYILYTEKFELCDFENCMNYFKGNEYLEKLFSAIQIAFEEKTQKFPDFHPSLQINVMEFMEDNQTVSDWAYNSDNTNVNRIIGSISTIYELLRCVSNSGILHSDLHLNNAMIYPPTGQVKLIDFGKVYLLDHNIINKFNRFFKNGYYTNATYLLIETIVSMDPPKNIQNADGSVTKYINNTLKLLKNNMFTVDANKNIIPNEDAFEILYNYEKKMEEYKNKVKREIGEDNYLKYILLNQRLNNYYYSLIIEKIENNISYSELNAWLKENELPEMKKKGGKKMQKKRHSKKHHSKKNIQKYTKKKNSKTPKK